MRSPLDPLAAALEHLALDPPSLYPSFATSSPIVLTPFCLMSFFDRAAVGAAYGTAKSGIGISGLGQFRPDLIMKSLIPVVMSGAFQPSPLYLLSCPYPVLPLSQRSSNGRADVYRPIWCRSIDLLGGRIASGIIAVYGLVVSVLIAGTLSPSEDYSLFAGFVHLGAGTACGMTGLAAGYAIGIVGDAVRSPSLPSGTPCGLSFGDLWCPCCRNAEFTAFSACVFASA